jgi:hypothetical protein
MNNPIAYIVIRKYADMPSISTAISSHAREDARPATSIPKAKGRR